MGDCTRVDLMPKPSRVLDAPLRFDSQARTSFDQMPGLVLLASGGLCEVFPDGDSVLEGLLHGGLLRVDGGTEGALGHICDHAHQQWQTNGGGGHLDAITGLLLHWPPEAYPEIRPAIRTRA